MHAKNANKGEQVMIKGTMRLLAFCSIRVHWRVR